MPRALVLSACVLLLTGASAATEPVARLRRILRTLASAAQLSVDVSVLYRAQERSCGATVLYPGSDANDSDDPVILVTPDIFSAGDTDSHLAFVLAHELGHVKLEHQKKQTETLTRYFWPWLNVRKQPKTGDPWVAGLAARWEQDRRIGNEEGVRSARAQLRARFLEEYGARIDEAQRPLEDAADLYAADLMLRAGMRPVGAEAVRAVMRHCNWMNVDAKAHSTPWKRAEDVFFRETGLR